MMRFFKIVLGLVVLLSIGFCVAVNLVNAPHKGETDDTNRESAIQIIRALELQKEAHGAYPAGLNALVPKHLKTLPRVQRSGNEFDYEVLLEGEDFRIAYPEAPIGALPSDAEYEYRASVERWELKVY